MQTSRLVAGSLAALALALIVLASVIGSRAGTSQAADPGIDDMSIDMDPSGAPANDKGTTGSNGVVGSIETCARVNENGTLDADEDSADTLLIDITAKGIGPSSPVVSFGATLVFPDTLVKVVSSDVTGQLLSAFPGSSAGDASEALPGTVSPWTAAGFDAAVETFESGDGPLVRIGIESATTSAGLGDLTLTGAGILTLDDGSYAPTTLGAAKVAVNRSCPGAGGALKGDTDCNDVVNSVDALRILRFVAGLNPNLPQGCDPIGAGFQAAPISAGNGALKGDMDCNDVVNSVDALRVLRFVAGLNPGLPQDCDPIGS